MVPWEVNEQHTFYKLRAEYPKRFPIDFLKESIAILPLSGRESRDAASLHLRTVTDLLVAIQKKRIRLTKRNQAYLDHLGIGSLYPDNTDSEERHAKRRVKASSPSKQTVKSARTDHRKTIEGIETLGLNEKQSRQLKGLAFALKMPILTVADVIALITAFITKPYAMPSYKRGLYRGFATTMVNTHLQKYLSEAA